MLSRKGSMCYVLWLALFTGISKTSNGGLVVGHGHEDIQVVLEKFKVPRITVTLTMYFTRLGHFAKPSCIAVQFI